MSYPEDWDEPGKEFTIMWSIDNFMPTKEDAVFDAIESNVDLQGASVWQVIDHSSKEVWEYHQQTDEWIQLATPYAPSDMEMMAVATYQIPPKHLLVKEKIPDMGD